MDYGNRNPHRKNRIPIDEHHLSSWVHEQRKAIKANPLTKEQRTLLERNGFVFDARFVFAAYGIDASSHGVGPSVAGPPTFLNSISQSEHDISQHEKTKSQLGEVDNNHVLAVETTNVVDNPEDTPDVPTDAYAPDTNQELEVDNNDASLVETTNIVANPDDTPDVSTDANAPDTNPELEADNNVASAVETTNVVDNSGDTPDVSTDANAPETNQLEVINNNVTQPLILSSDTPDVGVKDAVAATIAAKSTNIDDDSFFMRPNKPRVLCARMKGKVILPSDREVIEVDLLPASSDLSSNYHLFSFPDGISGVEKLNVLLQHEYSSSTSDFNGKIAMYMNGAQNKYELLYSDFTRYKNNAFMTCNVINAYFNLMNEHFKGRSIAFGTSFDGAVFKQGSFEFPIFGVLPIFLIRILEFLISWYEFSIMVTCFISIKNLFYLTSNVPMLPNNNMYKSSFLFFLFSMKLCA